MNAFEKGRRQRGRVLGYVRHYIQKNGYAPSFKEMEADLGLCKSHINHVLGQLDESGAILWSRGVSRGIVLPHGGGYSQNFLVPIAGTIEAGKGVSVPESDFSFYDWESCLEVPRQLIPNRRELIDKICALQVIGDSMEEEGVWHNDFVIGEVTDRWNDGDIVAALLVDEKLATLKRIEATERQNVKLIPANPAYQTRIFEQSKVLVQAKIFAVFHRLWQ
jgi:repressor LexA